MTDISLKYPYPVKYLDVYNNCRIAYMDVGTGPETIVFLHGLANYAPVWQKNMEVLQSKYRCIAIDLPGNGLSDRNEHPFTMTFFAETVYSFITGLGLTNVYLAGHSMGGQIALTTQLLFPNICNKLLLFAPAGFEAFSTLDKTVYYTTLHFLDHLSNEEHSLRHTMENSFYRLPQQANQLINELTSILRKDNLRYYSKMIESCVKSMLEEPVYPLLKRISAETLILFGKQDALIPNKLLHHTTTQRMAEEGAAKMPNATVHMLDNCGHFVQWEKADEANQIVLDFLHKKTA